MELSRIIFISQLAFGAVITCLSVYVFLNINTFVKLAIDTQLNLIWNLIALCLLVYGLLQMSQGMIEMLERLNEESNMVSK